MSKNRQKKLAIFNLFSQNLDWVKQNPAVTFEPDFSRGYICPLCFNVFFENELSNLAENILTIEDIPPVSLGGKPLALTCKKCNSKSGHDLDVHLLNRLLEIDAHSFLPNSKIKASFELDGKVVNGTFGIDATGKARLDLDSKRSNSKNSEYFTDKMFPPRTIYNPLFYPEKLFDNGYQSPSFHVKFNEISNERRAQIALLRIGYLLAFATFGNGFLINSGLYKVREQILNPDSEILPKIFWINKEFPRDLEGVSIITVPKELRSFLVIFKLSTPSQSRQFAVILPGPSSPGLDVYNFLNTDREVDTPGFMERLPKNDYLRNKNYAFGSHLYWQQYTKDDYKPRIRPNS